MRALLPWICLVACLIVVSAMPWRRSDPHHDFIFDLVHHLADDSEVVKASFGEPAPEAAQLEHHTVAGNPNRNRGSRI